MKITSWNINSVRARVNNIDEYLKKSKPDILLLQEIKTEEINFPFELFKKNGYHCYVNGQKAYNGVAIISKIELNNIKLNQLSDKNKQSRIISGEIKNKKINIINVYVPNGNPVNTDKFTYKITWLKLFFKELKKIKTKYKNIIIAGDFNIIPKELDVYNHKKYLNDALFLPEIRKFYDEIISLGFVDAFRKINPDKIEYTFWDYMFNAWSTNRGMRIDHFFVSSNLIDQIKSIKINKEPRARVKPSDHTPIELTIY